MICVQQAGHSDQFTDHDFPADDSSLYTDETLDSCQSKLVSDTQAISRLYFAATLTLSQPRGNTTLGQEYLIFIRDVKCKLLLKAEKIHLWSKEKVVFHNDADSLKSTHNTLYVATVGNCYSVSAANCLLNMKVPLFIFDTAFHFNPLVWNWRTRDIGWIAASFTTTARSGCS